MESSIRKSKKSLFKKFSMSMACLSLYLFNASFPLTDLILFKSLLLLPFIYSIIIHIIHLPLYNHY